VLIYLLTKLKHPGPLDDVTELCSWRKLYALVHLGMLVLCFVPIPILTWDLYQMLVQEAP